MRHSILASILLAFSFAVQADELLLSDIKAQNGVQLSVDELKQLMPGAKVTNVLETGSTRNWTNDSDGTFIASSDARSSRGAGGAKAATAQGTWHVGDNGTYCVTLEWKTRSENWCRYIFKVGEKYYGFSSIANGAAKAYSFEFSR